MTRVERVLRCAEETRPALVLEALSRGPGFPTFQIAPDGSVWWATAAHGPCLAHIAADAAAREVRLTAWGEGAAWVAERLPDLVGAHDDPTGFDPALLQSSPFAPVRDAHRRWGRWLRTPATGAVAEAAALAVLEQRITGRQARSAWVHLVRRFGEPAPGPAGIAPAGMRVPPTPAAWRAIPSWEWHAAGVDPARSGTLLRVMQRASALPRLLDLRPAEARTRLMSIHGVGPWTAAETAQRALGDADALSVGDYHLAETVVFALTGEDGGTDDDMLRLLEPAAGHRYRVQRLIERSGVTRPRRGPRITIEDHRGR